MLDITHFVYGRRVFLLGPRRTWHPHHKLSLLGDRGGCLVARPAAQAYQLRSGFALLRAVLDRGGRVWGFGTDSVHQIYPWGVSWPAWTSGRISNSPFFRQAFSEIAEESSLPTARERPRGRSRRRSRRWRHRWWLPSRQTPWSALTTLGGAASRRWFPGGLNPRITRRWAGRTAHRRAFHKVRPARPNLNPAGWPGRFERAQVRLAYRRLRRYNLVVHRVWLGLDPEPRVARSDNLRFPSCLVVHGGAGRTAALNEADRFGLPTVYFGSSSFTPWRTPTAVVWSPHPRAIHGVAKVIDRLWVTVQTARVVRAVWTRL